MAGPAVRPRRRWCQFANGGLPGGFLANVLRAAGFCSTYANTAFKAGTSDPDVTLAKTPLRRHRVGRLHCRQQSRCVEAKIIDSQGQPV